jgi:asparagine synthetase B (glutamine-hydrolysing)
MAALRARVDGLLRAIAAHAAPQQGANAMHVIAYSGGVDSSLAAALVAQVFPSTTAACLGVSPALAAHQLAQARRVATEIGIPLWECETTENELPQYVENKGQSCYYCKTTLYSTLQQTTAYAMWVSSLLARRALAGSTVLTVMVSAGNARLCLVVVMVSRSVLCCIMARTLTT